MVTQEMDDLMQKGWFFHPMCLQWSHVSFTLTYQNNLVLHRNILMINSEYVQSHHDFCSHLSPFCTHLLFKDSWYNWNDMHHHWTNPIAFNSIHSWGSFCMISFIWTKSSFFDSSISIRYKRTDLIIHGYRILVMNMINNILEHLQIFKCNC